MGWIITLIVGAIIGAIAGSITGKDFPAGMFGNIIAGLLGAWLGGKLFGDWGPSLGGIHIIPALLGSIVLVLIVSFVVKAARQ
ncbi:GlsB/YeaQ/YmgE family stress response membrane protein [Bacillus pacificus]|uniref:GlsB/YeaQ/YmgE family stress response membrane protein n=1 Tax=Bacillus pacificus TaxID=2026187 RepID=UPI003D1FA476